MKIIRILKICILLSLISLLNQCDHGLELPPLRTGISGTIYFQNWPPADSLRDLRIVAFRNFPPNDIFTEITSDPPRAFVYPTIGSNGLLFNVDSIEYVFELQPDIYEYIVVAQQYGPDVLADWQAVGQYNTTLTDSLPSAIEVKQDLLWEKINIYVDFDHLPIQPF